MAAPTRRKSSASVPAAAVAALSLLLTGCADESTVTADCVIRQADGTYKVVDDDKCDRGGSSSSSFVWIYGGTHNSSTRRITGGTMTKPSNSNISTRSGKVITGGFGGSGKSGSGS
ncbi:hypothetical protein SAMN05421505_12056 [Sinosporangium album]|uniref:Uncharacterized protein n=1 Tax=Sinosporangium album TaxID=504805 RepID=A0A1G8EDU1_9ACTN|nr:hypothetical protein [Sinosporangium album]SDH68062.1 hypothetical protein SAMN05421505_12056 [Sinosporangium album]